MRWKAIIETNKCGELITITPTKFDFIKTSHDIDALHQQPIIIPDKDDSRKLTMYFNCEDSVVEAVNVAQELYLGYIEGGFK